MCLCVSERVCMCAYTRTVHPLYMCTCVPASYSSMAEPTSQVSLPKLSMEVINIVSSLSLSPFVAIKPQCICYHCVAHVPTWARPYQPANDNYMNLSVHKPAKCHRRLPWAPWPCTCAVESSRHFDHYLSPLSRSHRCTVVFVTCGSACADGVHMECRSIVCEQTYVALFFFLY